MAKAQRVDHIVRSRDGGTLLIKGMTRSLADKLHCTECMGWDTDPADCTDAMCPHFPFRGRTRRANTSEAQAKPGRIMSDEQKTKMKAGRQAKQEALRA